MAKMKSPAFQFYVQDFIMGTLSFTPEEIGAYILLLCHQWDKGYILENEFEFVARLEKKKLQKVIDKFSLRDGRYYNKKMETVRKKKADFHKMQASKGKEGAKKRWQRPSPGQDPAIVLLKPNDSSSSSSSTSNTTTVVVEAWKKDPLFAMFRRAAGSHIPDDELVQEMGKFKNKYPNMHANKAGSLINAWVSRIGEVNVPNHVNMNSLL